MSYNVDFDICAAVLYFVIIICAYFSKDMKRQENKIFVVVSFLCFIATISDILTVPPLMHPEQYSRFYLYTINYIYFIFHNLTPILFYIYVVNSSGIILLKRLKNYWAAFLPGFAVVIILLVQPFYHWLYYFDSACGYHRNYMLNVLYLCSYFYAMLVLIHVIRFRKTMPKQRVFFMVIFVLAMICAVLFQSVYKDYLIELFTQAVTFFAILATIENQTELLDMKLGIYNRFGFERDNRVLMNSGNHYHVFIIKYTNIDTYTSLLGYETMGEVIKKISFWLDHLDKKTPAYFLNTKTFALIYKGDDKDILQDIKTQIEESKDADWMRQDMNLFLQPVIYVVDVPKDFWNLEQLDMLVHREEESLGTDSYKLIESKDLVSVQYEADLVKIINRAAQEKRFEVYYQPIWDCATHKIHSAEALIRLYDEELGFISPEDFIPISEKNGMIMQIGEFVFEEVCRFISSVDMDALGLKFIEVNLSTVQCMSQNLPETIERIMKKWHVSAGNINLEITESAAATNPEQLRNNMRRLREMGFTFSMDDFGTGYSNIISFFKLDFEIIKIDKSILWDADENAKGDVILQNTIRMIKDVDRQIITEGVETKEQRDKLIRLGCDYCQGFYYSKPIPRDQFIQFVMDFNENKKIVLN